jgi:hypothetical protein
MRQPLLLPEPEQHKGECLSRVQALILKSLRPD